MIDDGGPVFPRIATGDGVNYTEGYVYTFHEGMSLRTYFAGLAMQGLAADPNITPGRVIELAVQIADDLIAALKKEAP